MTLTAPRPTLILAAACLIGLGVLLQLGLGYRVSQGSAHAMEFLALVLYGAAIVLLLAPLGRSKALIAGALAFILMAWAVHLNARLSAFLELQAGGQVIAAHRILLHTLFVGPFAGLITGVVTGLIARFERIRWTPRQPVS
jgi:hypothetical protein